MDEQKGGVRTGLGVEQHDDGYSARKSGILGNPMLLRIFIGVQFPSGLFLVLVGGLEKQQMRRLRQGSAESSLEWGLGICPCLAAITNTPAQFQVYALILQFIHQLGIYLVSLANGNMLARSFYFFSSCPAKVPNRTTSTSRVSVSTRTSSPVFWKRGMESTRTRVGELFPVSVISVSPPSRRSGIMSSIRVVLKLGWLPAKKICGQASSTNGSTSWKG